LVNLARKHKLALISDEVYERFTYEPSKPFYSLMKEYENNSDVNLIIVNSASKPLSMIGDRIGYVASN